MLYEILGRVQTTGGNISCAKADGINGTANATLAVSDANEAWITWVGGTEYDMNAGDAAHNFSFHGSDPHDSLLTQLNEATGSNTSSSSILDQHVADYTAVISKFSLDLGQKPDLATPTDQLWQAYETDVGDSYVEWLLFNFGRYLLVGSSRGLLPANLQGKWASDVASAWSAGMCFHLMLYWFLTFNQYRLS
jgi:alpha-L-fucosidase 2